jgi:hypothetical protein
MAFHTTAHKTYAAPTLIPIERPSQAILRLAAPASELVAARRRGPWRVLRQPTLAEWAEVRRLHTEGAGIDQIARAMKVSRRSVRHILYPWPHV